MSACASLISDLRGRGWTILPDFLPADAVAVLREEAQGLWAARRFRQAGVGRGPGYAVRRDVRGDQILWLEQESATPAQGRFWPEIERLRLELNRELFLGLVSFEGHYAVYPPGARYEAHLDRFGTSDERAVSCTLYLNAGWTDGHGGLLRLHLTGCHVDIPPRRGTLVLFRSDTVRHEVLPATRSRFSLTGWFRRRPLRAALLSCMLAASMLSGVAGSALAAESPVSSQETDDGMVSVERAKVPGMADFLVVPRNHTFITRSREAIAQTVMFLQTGKFDHAEPPRTSS